MAGGSGNGKLRQWLIEQVDTGKYPGLVWENEEKSIFRIPWKHAGKQDYNRDEDAALFKAWALFKGKYREGIDKPDPPTWKTRLRCALNKSNDFEELVERSQLDISDPYKVYKIVPEGSKKGKGGEKHQMTSNRDPDLLKIHSPIQAHPVIQYTHLIHQHQLRCATIFLQQTEDGGIIPPYLRSLTARAPTLHAGTLFSGSFYSCNASDPQLSPFTLDTSMRSAEAMALSDYRLHVVVFYRDTLVREVTVSSPEGCQLGPSREEQAYASPGAPELVELPHAEGASLERGVILWMAPDGLYARRRCPCRVYWEGAHAPPTDKPNKLEREQNCKLLDTHLFITELQSYALHTRPAPCSQVLLFFEDESTDTQRPRRTFTVQVEPLFARQLLFLTHPGSMNYIRSHELSHLPPEHTLSPTQDYHRVITHHHNSGPQN
ncbi:hypothetical protein cypCar_00028366 [Cyprinus carpio]|nr:hypothetical protein cypCar_00028366 [Cyprinus carpio]